MNNDHYSLEVIAKILKMGIISERKIQQQLGLATDEYIHYRNYLLRTSLAQEITVNESDGLLQPTSCGKALVRVADMLGNLDNRDDPVKKDYSGPEKDAVSALSPKATNIKMIKTKLLQAYILAQAEVSRLEIQLDEVSTDSDEGDIDLEVNLQKLSILQSLIEAVGRMSSKASSLFSE